MPWITAADVVAFLGQPPAAGSPDEAWLDQCVDAANAVGPRRRAEAGYTDDPDVVPDGAVKQGTVLYAGARYRSRGAVDGFASFDQLGTFTPTGATWGEIRVLWGTDRPQVDRLPTDPATGQPPWYGWGRPLPWPS